MATADADSVLPDLATAGATLQGMSTSQQCSDSNDDSMSFPGLDDLPPLASTVDGEDSPVSSSDVVTSPRSWSSNNAERSGSDASSIDVASSDVDGVATHESPSEAPLGQLDTNAAVNDMAALPSPTTPSEPVVRPQRRYKTIRIIQDTQSSAVKTPAASLDEQVAAANDTPDHIDESWLVDDVTSATEPSQGFVPVVNNGPSPVLYTTGLQLVIVPVNNRSRATLQQVFDAIGTVAFTDFERALLDAGLQYGSGHADAHVTFVREAADGLLRATATFANAHATDGEVGKVQLKLWRKELNKQFGWTEDSFVDRRSIARKA